MNKFYFKIMNLRRLLRFMIGLNYYASLSKVLVISILISVSVKAQEAEPRLDVRYITDVIKIDGVLDEEIWKSADVADNFWQFFPTDSVRAKQNTEVRILYDETTIYVSIRANSASGKYVVSSLRRDFSGASNDNVSLIFDTFSDRTNAFMFGVTPYGVQREVQISEGGASRNGFNPTWDMKWQAESKMFDDHYDVEIAIPFTSLKFREGVDTWGFRAYRWDFQTSEQSTWVRVPQNQLMSNLAFMGDLVFEKPLGKSRTPFAIIPYVNGLSSKDFETGETDNKFKFGGDAKIAIGNSMNLDLTVNPDFSNVEVDDIFTNLTRFEVLLPEKRQFFIDNSDLFANFGSFRDAAPFFSRRIGLARDTSANLIENRIIGGARLSGKLNQDWRLGFLNIQTDEDVANEIPSNNNMMLAVQRRVFARSNVGFFMINRQTFKDYEFQEEDKYNRVIGADFNLASADNVWSGKFYLHKSFQPNDTKGNLSSQAFLTYNSRYWRFTTDFVYVDKDFTSDLGFIPRKDIFKNGNAITRTFYPKKGIINANSLRFLSLVWWRPNLDFKKSDHNLSLSWASEFKNQSSTELEVKNNYIFLTDDFDPTRTEDGVPLPGNTGYTFSDVSIQYESNPANIFTISGESTAGQFFTGNRFSVGGEMGVRFQPWVVLSLAFRYDQIRLPDPHPDADYWLLTPKLDVTFTKSLFWSTLVQYSNQRDNLGINSRLQWRYAPLSDLYLVYNDNYFYRPFWPKIQVDKSEGHVLVEYLIDFVVNFVKFIMEQSINKKPDLKFIL